MKKSFNSKIILRNALISLAFALVCMLIPLLVIKNSNLIFDMFSKNEILIIIIDDVAKSKINLPIFLYVVYFLIFLLIFMLFKKKCFIIIAALITTIIFCIITVLFSTADDIYIFQIINSFKEYL